MILPIGKFKSYRYIGRTCFGYFNEAVHLILALPENNFRESEGTAIKYPKPPYYLNFPISEERK